MNERVTVITVAYQSQDVLPDMLASVPTQTPIIVVDNGSPDPVQVNTAHVIRNSTNEGFGRACNQGAAVARTEFLLFLNPDARLHPDALEALVHSANTSPDAAGWNPRFNDGKGSETFQRRSKIDPKRTATAVPLPKLDCPIGTLQGSAIFLRKDLFDLVQGFDPAIFLYHEDDDLSLRLRAHGPLMRSYGAQVTHLEGRGSPRTPNTAYFKAFHMARSRRYAYGKHGHRFAHISTLRQAVLGLLSPLNLGSKRKRAKAWGFFKGALSAFRDGGVYHG
ncbi:MAG: glycosyltransferase family 2 protein [Paracoccaceae bacterium]